MTQLFSRRRLIQYGCGAGALAALSGCTSPSVSGSPGAKGAAGKEPLSMLLLGANQDAISYVNNTVLPKFQSQTGIKVQLITSDWGSAFQKVVTEAASNSLPDVVHIGGIWTAPLASKNVMLDITDRFDSWSDKAQFRSAGVASASYKDHLYGVPFMMDVRSGVYRQDLLKAAGVSDLPTTWDEFRQAAQQVKAKASVKIPIDWGMNKSIALQQAYAQLFFQAGGKYWDASGKASFNSEAGVKSLTFLVDTYKQGLADVHQVYSGNGPNGLVSGESAMTYNGWTVQQNAIQYKKNVENDIVAGPALKMDAQSKPVGVSWIDKLTIARNSKNPDGAWKLLTFMTSKEQMTKFAQLYGNLPTRKDLSTASWLTPMAKQVLATADDAISQPNNPVMLQLGPAVEALLEPAIRGSVSVVDTLKAIDQKVDSLSG